MARGPVRHPALPITKRRQLSATAIRQKELTAHTFLSLLVIYNNPPSKGAPLYCIGGSDPPKPTRLARRRPRPDIENELESMLACSI